MTRSLPRFWIGTPPPDQPAAPTAGIALRLTIGRPWPGVGDLGRYAKKIES
jgi:hypothetical protein